MNKTILSLVLTFSTLLAISSARGADDPSAAGLNVSLDNIARLYNVQSRSISAENFTGEKGQGGMATEGTGKGAARDLGRGWKVSPSVVIKGKSTFTLAEIKGPGSIRSIWMTPTGNWRTSILRFYWDDETDPSVEVPVADFFASGWAQWDRCPLIQSLPVCVNPRCGFNCYWPMPFHKKCRITMENLADDQMVLYYQVNYALGEVPENAAYFHAQFHRENPLKTKGTYTILDGVEGNGQYVGTYLAWGVHHTGWWGEGEIKFFIDGDQEFPTICGTGTEDYFCGAYDFEGSGPNGKTVYTEFTTPYTGLPQVIRPDGLYDAVQRFSLYRWHIPDPVRFQHDLKVTIQALGWQPGGRYLPLDDDVASVAFWYQQEPHKKFPQLPSRDELEWH
ncbi:MAG: glycoside hydrolase family 172 protein [Limisphaerales bacterium]